MHALGEIILLNPVFFESKNQSEKLRKLEERKYLCDIPLWSVDKTHPDYSTQEDIFNLVGKPLIQDTLEGLNCSLFAYGNYSPFPFLTPVAGQTGSGKTYTMMGNPTPEELGIIPRFCSELFRQLNRSKEASQLLINSTDTEADVSSPCVMEAGVEVSYYEIYNERIYDLLSSTPETACKVREHPTEGAYVEGLTLRTVQSYDEIAVVLEEGQSQRQVAETLMNATSSRSHAVFTLHLTQKMMIPIPKHIAAASKRKPSNVSEIMIRKSKVNLIDLAGSERLNSTGATGDRLKEATNINRSLFVLGEVIKTLSENSDKGTEGGFVPYRNSLLTWILKDSLGGNSKTTMLATVSPIGQSHAESTNTLRYIERAKLVSSKAQVNDDNANDPYIKHLQQQVALYKGKLSTALTQLREKEAEMEKKVSELTEEMERLHSQLKDSNRLSRRLSRGLSAADINSLSTAGDQLSPGRPQSTQLLRSGSSVSNRSNSNSRRLSSHVEQEDMSHLQIDILGLASSSHSSIDGDPQDRDQDQDGLGLAIELDKDSDDELSSLRDRQGGNRPAVRSLATEVRQLQEALSLSMLECEEMRQRLIDSEESSRLELEYLQERLLVQQTQATAAAVAASVSAASVSDILSADTTSADPPVTSAAAAAASASVDHAWTICQLEDRLVDTNAMIETLQLRLSQKETEIQELKETGKSALAELKRTTETMVCELESRCFAQETTVSNQKEHIASLLTRLHIFDQSFTLQTQEHRELSSRYEQAILDLKELLQENDTQLHQQLSVLEEELRMSHEESLSVRVERETAEVKHSQELQELCEEMERMNLLINQKIQSYESQLRSNRDEIKQLQLDLSAATATASAAASGSEAMEELKGRVSEFTRQEEEKQKMIVELRRQLEISQQRISELELSLSQQPQPTLAPSPVAPVPPAAASIAQPRRPSLLKPPSFSSSLSSALSPSSSATASGSGLSPVSPPDSTTPAMTGTGPGGGRRTRTGSKKSLLRRSFSHDPTQQSNNSNSSSLSLDKLRACLLEKERELEDTKLEHEQDILEFCEEVLKLKALVDSKVQEFGEMNGRHEEIVLSSQLAMEALQKELEEVQSLHEIRLQEVLSDLEQLQEDIQKKVPGTSSIPSVSAEPSLPLPSLEPLLGESSGVVEGLTGDSLPSSSPRDQQQQRRKSLSSPGSVSGSSGGSSSPRTDPELLQGEVMKELKLLRKRLEEQEKSHEAAKGELQRELEACQEEQRREAKRVTELEQQLQRKEEQQVQQQKDAEDRKKEAESVIAVLEREKALLKAQLDSTLQLSDDPRAAAGAGGGKGGKRGGGFFCGGR
jgi:hypothetical protein